MWMWHAAFVLGLRVSIMVPKLWFALDTCQVVVIEACDNNSIAISFR